MVFNDSRQLSFSVDADSSKETTVALSVLVKSFGVPSLLLQQSTNKHNKGGSGHSCP